MRLVGSSDPGDVDRDAAVHLLTARAVLTRAVCRELAEAGTEFAGRRPCVALGVLLEWVAKHFPECVRVEPHASDGLDQMTVPDGCEALFREIRAGSAVAEALFMLTTADNALEARGDEERIRDRLAAYLADHPTAVRAPLSMECWSGFKSAPPASG